MLAIALAAAAALFHLHETGRDLDFQYDWSANASAIRPLANQLRAEMKHDRARSAALAASDYKGSLKGTYPFHRHEFARKLEFMGQSPRLASFVDYHSSYTGGAHPNSSKALLLWDKSVEPADQVRRPVQSPAVDASANRLLQGPGSRTAEEARSCDAVRRLLAGLPGFPLAQSVVPRDSDHDGRFDELSIIASPLCRRALRGGLLRRELARLGAPDRGAQAASTAARSRLSGNNRGRAPIGRPRGGARRGRSACRPHRPPVRRRAGKLSPVPTTSAVTFRRDARPM